MTLADRFPDTADPDAVFDAFAAWAQEQGLTLYPHQEEALIEIVSGANVILSTPTGSGKSLVATGAHFAALAHGQGTFYTAPIKALVSEKFFALCDIFGPSNVGMMTGDASVNPDAPIICCTAEMLANIALREGAARRHRPGGDGRVPLLRRPGPRLGLAGAADRAAAGPVPADVGDARRRQPVREGPDPAHRPPHRGGALRASARYRCCSPTPPPLHETLEELLATHQAPVYVVHFTQAAALEQAQALMSINVCTRAEKDAIAEVIGGFRFTAGFGKTLSRLVRHGIGVHHAGMLPKYRRLVETLAQAGLLKVICGTDTLGVGINVPIRTVLFTALSKYDGKRTRLLQAREFHQIAGRAGRAGYDTAGTVVVQAPEHVVENEKALAKAGDDPKKRRKVVRKKPPEGLVSWGRPTFERLVAAEPEPLKSSFEVSHAMLLNVIARPGDAFTAMRHLLTDNHEDRPAQRRHIHRAIAIYRALLAAGVVERLPEPDEQGRCVRLTVDLQLDFALNQPLSPFALAAIELLDRASPTYALDVLSVIESTLENPRQVLSAQQFKARGEAVAQMKADGIEYEERMELLEDGHLPQAAGRPAGGRLRHLPPGPPVGRRLRAGAQVGGPRHVRAGDDASPSTSASTAWPGPRGWCCATWPTRTRRCGRPCRRRPRPRSWPTSSSGSASWSGRSTPACSTSGSGCATGEDVAGRWQAVLEAAPPPVTGNVRAFRVLVRNALFRRVELAALRRYDELGALDAEAGWDADAWAGRAGAVLRRARRDRHRPGRPRPGTADHRRAARPLAGPADLRRPGRRPRLGPVSAEVDLAASDEAGEAVLPVTDVGQLG